MRGFKHGFCYTRTYNIWIQMLGRCRNPNRPDYKYYGGRGIRVCRRWLDFELFFADMGHCPLANSIERVDNEKDYEPGNCIWLSMSLQSRHRRSNKITLATARLIRDAVKTGTRRAEMAARYDVSLSTIDQIIRREIWKEAA